MLELPNSPRHGVFGQQESKTVCLWILCLYFGTGNKNCWFYSVLDKHPILPRKCVQISYSFFAENGDSNFLLKYNAGLPAILKADARTHKKIYVFFDLLCFRYHSLNGHIFWYYTFLTVNYQTLLDNNWIWMNIWQSICPKLKLWDINYRLTLQL